MATKIRLQRKGRSKRPFYHIVIADARAPRDGRFIEKVGTYNPMTDPATIELDMDRTFYWMNTGAQPTETVRSILRFKGLLFKKHLQRGVTKGALTQEQADLQWEEFQASKNAKLAERIAKKSEERKDKLEALSGKAAPAPEPEVEEEVQDTVEDTAAEETTPDADAPETEAEANEAPEADASAETEEKTEE